MGSEEKNTIETQIRSACPQEAIGYRLVVLTTTPTVYPIRALHGRDYYIVNPELVEFPTGTPVGLHQLQFVDAGGSTIPLSRQIKVRIAAEEQTEQASDEDEPEGQEPAPSGDTGAASFQSKAQELVLQRRRLRNARMARKTSEIGEYHAHWSGLFEDTVRRLERLDELSKLHHEAQLAITQRMTTELTKIPGPPPPPQDWVGLIKTGIDGVQSVVTTAINARGSAKSQESGPLSSELSEKLAEKLAEKLTERLVDKLASRLSGRGAIEAVSTTADAVTPSVSAAPPIAAPAPIQSAAAAGPAASPTVPAAAAAGGASISAIAAGLAATADAADAAVARVATTSPGAAASTSKAAAPPASNNDKDPPAPPAAPSVRADAPAPVAKPTENVYARSWLAMRRVIAKLTDLDIINMVANPALLVSFIGLLAALAPESIQSALPQPIPQEAHR